MNTIAKLSTIPGAPSPVRRRLLPHLLVLTAAVAAAGCARIDPDSPPATAYRSSGGGQAASTTPPAAAPAAATRTVSAGTGVSARFETTLDSGVANVGDSVRATVTSDVHDSSGQVALPAGTVLTGKVTDVQAARKVHKMASLSFRFDRATRPDGTSADMSASMGMDGKGWTKKQGAIIGGSAAGGAVLGQVLGKDTESTLGGAVVGGAIATGVIMSHKGEDVVISSGTSVDLTLDHAMNV